MVERLQGPRRRPRKTRPATTSSSQRPTNSARPRAKLKLAAEREDAAELAKRPAEAPPALEAFQAAAATYGFEDCGAEARHVDARPTWRAPSRPKNQKPLRQRSRAEEAARRSAPKKRPPKPAEPAAAPTSGGGGTGGGGGKRRRRVVRRQRPRRRLERPAARRPPASAARS